MNTVVGFLLPVQLCSTAKRHSVDLQWWARKQHLPHSKLGCHWGKTSWELLGQHLHWRWFHVLHHVWIPCAILHKASRSPEREKYQTSWLYDEWQKFSLFRHHPRLGFNCLITGLENSRAYKWWRTRNRGCRRSGANGPDGMTWRYVKDGLLWTLVYFTFKARYHEGEFRSDSQHHTPPFPSAHLSPFSSKVATWIKWDISGQILCVGMVWFASEGSC